MINIFYLVSNGNSEGRRVLKAKLLKESFEPKLEFPEMRRVQIKITLCRGSNGYFLEQHHVFTN